MPKGKEGQNKKIIHPYSRKAAQLARQGHKQEKKERLKTEKVLRLNTVGEKLQWFQKQLDPQKTNYTKKDACEIIERYLHRFDSELEQIELLNSIKGRQGRQHASRESVIKQTTERERLLYEGCGIEIPDIVNAKNLEVFREWDGDLQKLPNIKMRKISSKDLALSRKDTKNSDSVEPIQESDKDEYAAASSEEAMSEEQ
ncbi:translation machinery-associated protein 16 [Latimeria chalumnae]|uniref:Translation machinery-associated protein 16 n=1 Tax=Latimeria chalumnae TaxID=7897 RepID=H3AHD6_LATCH|nr:PREDICTED: translation machinery-associated protein 16 [Latimeria chalumnae]|eukprot:XP_006007124.1 PREDICTED: translation machinery-associated protein 16 [Latimeria chalumnae]